MTFPISPIKRSIYADTQHALAFNTLGELIITPGRRFAFTSENHNPVTSQVIGSKVQLAYSDENYQTIEPEVMVNSIVGYSAATQSGMLYIVELGEHTYSQFEKNDPLPSAYYTLAKFPLGPGATFSFDTPVYTGTYYATPHWTAPDRSIGIGVYFVSPDGGGICFTAIVQAKPNY